MIKAIKLSAAKAAAKTVIFKRAGSNLLIMIRLARKSLRFLVHSNIYLSFGASVVAWLTLFVMQLPFEPALLFIPFAGGMFIYNLNRHTDDKEDIINVPERRRFISEHGFYLMVISSAMYLGALYLASMRGWHVLLVAALPGAIASLYSIKRLKRLFFFKNALVGLSWGLTPLLVGFYNNLFGPGFFLLAAFFAIAFFVNTVIFDVKDVIGDSNAKIRTIPIRLGIEKTRTVCHAANALALVVLVSSVFLRVLPVGALVLVPFLAYIYFYTRSAGEKKDGFFYGLVVDGEFVFLFFILSFLTIIGA